MDPPSPRRRCSDASKGHTSMVGDSKCRSRPYYFRQPTTTSIDSLPDELLFLILVGLPADYLRDRARLVCRRWYHIIQSHSFIEAHHQRSTYCLLYSYNQWNLNWHPSWMMTATQGLIQTNKFNYICRHRFLGTCNGLMLEMLSHVNNTISLQIINPVTKQALLLPPFTAPVGSTVYNPFCGIAYAAASMKYKVAISYLTYSTISQSGLAILSVGVDNSWRQVRVDQCLPPCAWELLTSTILLTEGFMHWVEQYEGKAVVTLDVETEILTLSEVPSPYDEGYSKPMFYLSTGRSLSLLMGQSGLSGEYMLFFEVWEMNPETKEWMKLVDADIKLGAQKQQRRLQQLGMRSFDYFQPCGWVKYPEVLVLSKSENDDENDEIRTLIFYNLDTHEISLTELPDPVTYHTDAMYKSSLKWLT